MDHGALLTDLYTLHMLRSYRALGMQRTAVFDFVVRRMPPGRNFLVAAGLEQVVEFLTGLHFTDEDLAWLEGEGRFPHEFVRSLADLHFTGDLCALPEGTVFFPGEPVVRVSAPIAEAQLVESRLTNILQFSILVASKAVRCVLAAAGRDLVECGLRRAHGAEAALLAARAGFLAGYNATATVLAGLRYGIPVAGTLTPSYLRLHDREQDAIAALARTCGGCTLLLDPDDVPRALDYVVELAGRLRQADGGHISAVRIDSGDLAQLARLARSRLDAAGCGDIRIVASGDLDEYRIAALVAGGAPIDAFGVGTRVSMSADAPSLDCAYEFAQYAGAGRRQRAPGRESWPGAKQVFRRADDNGIIVRDTLGLETEAVPGRPLLEPVLRAGQRVAPCWSLAHLRQELRSQLATLPPAMLELEAAPPLTVQVSPGLRQLACQVDRKQA